jgi:outer membrane receptor protein involved in Fe transport
LNYGFHWNAWGRDFEIFVQPEIINLFDEQAVTNVNNDIADFNTASSTCSGGCQQFNPFTTTPVEGTHWAKRADFGQPEDENDYQTPRTYRFSVGFRF